MANPTLRNMVKLIESALVSEDGKFDDIERDADGRLISPDAKYKVTDKKATVELSSNLSQRATLLAKKVQEMRDLQKQLDQLTTEVEDEGRAVIADVHAASDEVKTRVVDTVSFVMQLNAAAKDVKTVKYAEVTKGIGEAINTLDTKMIPELEAVQLQLKEKLSFLLESNSSTHDKKSVFKIEPKESLDLSEGPMDSVKAFFSKFTSWIQKWSKKYDAELNQLKSMVGDLEVTEAFGGPGYVNQGGENMNDSSALNEDADNQAIIEMNGVVNDAMQELNSLQISFDNSGYSDETLNSAMEEFFGAATKFKAALSAIAGTDLEDPVF